MGFNQVTQDKKKTGIFYRQEGGAKQHCKTIVGIVQKVFSEKASAMRQKCVRNASEMRQKCVRNASKWVLFFIGKRGTSKMHQKSFKIASKMRQKCVKNARNTFGGEHLLDDTEIVSQSSQVSGLGRPYAELNETCFFVQLGSAALENRMLSPCISNIKACRSRGRKTTTTTATATSTTIQTQVKLQVALIGTC